MNKRLQLYRGLMVEARLRVEAIDVITANTSTPSQINYESAALQIRFLCEIIALACIAAHDSPSQINYDTKKQHRPYDIFERLEELNDNFFPEPIGPLRPNGPNQWHFAEPSRKEIANKQDIMNIWKLCGKIVHRGDYRKLLKPKAQTQFHFSDIDLWKSSLLNLISNHRILSADQNRVLVAYLFGDDEVRVFSGEAMDQ